MNSGCYILIGAGGTGSILAPLLARHLQATYDDSYNLAIFDGDVIEPKNLLRQAWTPEDVGKTKAQVLADRITYAGFNTRWLDYYIDDTNVAELILDGDTVLIAVDNFPLRATIERHALTLKNLTVINGGNEETTSTVQIFIRRDGENITPPLSYQHPEILKPGLTRAEEDCLVRAANPNNKQTIAANFLSAAWMLAALVHVEQGPIANVSWNDADENLITHPFWHELHTDLHLGRAGGPDWRDMGTDAWKTYAPPALELAEVAA